MAGSITAYKREIPSATEAWKLLDHWRRYDDTVLAPVPVNTRAEAEDIIAELTAAGKAPTSLRPLQVIRNDLGKRLETYADGTWTIGSLMPTRVLARTPVTTLNSDAELYLGAGWAVEPGDGGDSCGITYLDGILTVEYTGMYDIDAQMKFYTPQGGNRVVNIRRLGDGKNICRTAQPGEGPNGTVYTCRKAKLLAGEKLQIVVFQSSGSAGTIEPGDRESFWQIQYVGPSA